MSLSQTEKDLQRYAQDKLVLYIKDVSQAFDIAGIKRDSLTCLGATLLRAAAHVALTCGADKELFLRWAGASYDTSQQQHKHYYERKD